MESKAKFEPARAILDEIAKSPEQALIQELESIRWSFKMVQGNFCDLIQPIELLEEKPEGIKLWSRENKQKLHRLFEEIARLLHNFLASNMSFVDHTRAHINKLYSGKKYAQFLEQYQIEISSRFSNNANHQIAQGLRNYVQHRNLPFVGSTISWNREKGESRSFHILIEQLLEWHGWVDYPLAKAKLQQMGKFLEIRPFIEEYFSQVSSFYQWLVDKQMEMHKLEISKLKLMEKRAKQALDNK